MKQLMILGTFHMESQLDVTKTEHMELLHEMGDEINLLVEKIAQYQPTKIFVEIPKTQQKPLDLAYQRFLAGEASSSSEVVKVAFPLAQRAKSPIYAVDWMEWGAGVRDCGDVMEELEKDPSLKKEINQFNTVNIRLENNLNQDDESCAGDNNHIHIKDALLLETLGLVENKKYTYRYLLQQGLCDYKTLKKNMQNQLKDSM